VEGPQVVGVVALAVVLLVVVAIALLRGRFDGRLRATGGEAAGLFGGLRRNRQDVGAAVGVGPALDDLGISLPVGKITVVQFSGEFCAICPQARTVVERVLRDHPDVAHVEVDVADHIEAVRGLDIRRTPTLLIVDERGRPVHRASGMPREAELRQAVGDLAARA
jgi:thiol-disulfide isomerase/thioredoxin